MSPTWYDILGVEPDATPEQIKAAWRDSTDKFEPGSGGSRFRMFNEAADILLDPAKRRAYDAELAGGQALVEPSPVVEPVETPEASPAVEPVETPEPSPAVEPAETPEAQRTSWLARYARWLRAQYTSTLGLAILGVLATAALILTVVLAIDLDKRVDEASQGAGSFDLDDGAAASSVAERAVAALLAYDYRSMDADRDRALTFLTPAYQQTYEKIFDGLINGTDAAPGGAIKSKAVVASEVLSTAVVDADGDTVRVLVFVNQQPTTNGKQQPVLANRVVATMVERDGTWLLDKIDPLSAGF